MIIESSRQLRSGLSSVQRRQIFHLAALIAATFVALQWSYRLWRLSPRRPILYAGDELAVFGHVETVDRSGWWYTNDQWGSPFGLEHYDFPHGGDHLHVLTIRMLGFFSDDPVLITNVFFFGSFFSIAVVSFLVFRQLRISPAVSGVASVLFTFLPFHFWHGTPHIYRSPYYLVPVGGLVLLWLAGQDGGFFNQQILRRRRLAFAIGVSVLLAMSDTVALAFPMTLAAALGLVALLGGRGWRTLLVAAGLAAVMATSLLVNNLPTLLYQADNGANPITLQRVVSEQERFGLKVASLVLPQSDHPIDALADIGSKPYEESLFRSEGGQSLGTAGAIGLIAGVVALLGVALGTRRGSDSGEQETAFGDEEGLLRRCGALSLIAIVFGVPTGLAFVLGIFGFEEFRTWNRIVVYIGFFSLVGFGVVLDRFRRRLERLGARRVVIVTALIFLLGLGVWDQSPDQPPDYDTAAAFFNSDAEFFHSVEAAYPNGGQIFALPIVPYPEPSLSEAPGPYRHMIALIHTSRLETSYGGMKGREWEWQRELARLPSDLALKALRSAGFEGIYIDRWNYADGGAAAEAALTEAIGSAPSIDAANGAFAYWDLRSLRTDLSTENNAILGEEITRPVVAMLGDGFFSKPRSNALSSFAGEEAQLVIRNMTDELHEVVVELEIRTEGGSVDISGPFAWSIESASNVTTAEAVIIVPPGDTPIELRTDGASYQIVGDPREIHMSVTVGVTGVLLDEMLNSDSVASSFPAFSQ